MPVVRLTWSVLNGSFTVCPDGLQESKTWKIVWQDGNIYNRSNSASGECCRFQECPPRLEEPRSFPTSIQGVASEEWAETAYDRRCNGLGCQNNGPPRTITETHSCPIASIPGGCNGAPDYSQYPTTGCASGFVLSGGVCTRSNEFINRCDRFGGYNFDGCGCFGGCEDEYGNNCSPVVIDIDGNGFNLTDALNGVDFDVDGNGAPERRAWTSLNSDDSWLALDRNGNGRIDGGRELFGSATAQPPPPAGTELNGFNALAQYDERGFGGNKDGQIDNQDLIFSSLRLWRDTNHNGISEASELKTLSESGLQKIELDYKESRRTDEYGNQFKYRSKVKDANGAQLGRWAWDVFLVR